MIGFHLCTLCNVLMFILNVFSQEAVPKVGDYPFNVPGSCGSLTKFDCGNGKCIDFSLVRNCVDNCGNGADEVCGSGMTLCDTQVALSGCGKCVYSGSESSYCEDQRYAKLCSQPEIFKCIHTKNCVLKSWLLNGANECGDLSDENPCYTNLSSCDNTASCSYNYQTKQTICSCLGSSAGVTSSCMQDPLFKKIPGKCSVTPLQFDCGEKCIGIQEFRDCKKDCMDGSDETCWQGLSSCSDGCTCVSQGRQKQDCPASSDPCLIQKTNCSVNANCFSTSSNGSYVCKCKPGYIGNGKTCTYAVLHDMYGMKMKIQRDAAQAPNKIDILSRIPGTCQISPLQFDCGNGICIEIEKFRDCRQDCIDGSDETCWDGQAKCDGCKCVDPKDVTTTCNDVDTCTSAGMFKCNGGGCVFDEMVLDGTLNCADQSDENYCTTVLLNCPSETPCRYNTLLHNFQCGCPTGTQFNSTRGICQVTSGQIGFPSDCSDFQIQSRTTGSGVFTVYKPTCATVGGCAMQVYCDFDLEGGGWTIIQHRSTGVTDFYTTWNNYKNGFGSMSSDFWLGNEYVSELTHLTNRQTYELLILMTTFDGQAVRARYDRFQLGPESDYYRLTLGTFTQGDNDNLAASRDQRFGTRDMDVDSDPDVTCGEFWESGWWHQTKCDRTGDLNLPYNPVPQFGQLAGIIWTGTSRNARMKETNMMIRPINFKLPDVTTITTIIITTKNPATLPHGTVPIGRGKCSTTRSNQFIIIFIFVTTYLFHFYIEIV